jgi:hypothetical protein
MGKGTRLLELFDERTRQQLLAPAGKRLALSYLALDGLQYVFSADFGTVNGELAGCLLGAPTAANIPCIFHTEQPRPDALHENPTLAGASEAFAAGRVEDAQQLVKIALKQRPLDPEALYLDRVFEREKQSRTGAVARVAPTN